jgi:hypothetical protein
MKKTAVYFSLVEMRKRKESNFPISWIIVSSFIESVSPKILEKNTLSMRT